MQPEIEIRMRTTKTPESMFAWLLLTTNENLKRHKADSKILIFSTCFGLVAPGIHLAWSRERINRYFWRALNYKQQSILMC